GCGAWSQGPVLLEALNILEGLDLRTAGHNSPDYVHTVAEALLLAFADREAYIGDPRQVDVPLAGLLSKAYAARQRARIGRRAACNRGWTRRTQAPWPPASARA